MTNPTEKIKEIEREKLIRKVEKKYDIKNKCCVDFDEDWFNICKMALEQREKDIEKIIDDKIKLCSKAWEDNEEIKVTIQSWLNELKSKIKEEKSKWEKNLKL